MDANTQLTDDAAVQAVADLVATAEQTGASDVHLHFNGGGARVDFRLDGLMTPREPLPTEIAERVFGRIKYLARLKTYQDSLPQDGRIAREDLGAEQDVRAVAMGIVDGEMEVLAAGAWQEFAPGRHVYPVEAGAAVNLPEGEFVFTCGEDFIRLEWLPDERLGKRAVRREVKLK